MVPCAAASDLSSLRLFLGSSIASFDHHSSRRLQQLLEERERDEKEEEEVVEEVEDVRFVSASTLLSPFPPYDFIPFRFLLT